MQHGDISNQRSFVIGFRCENSLLHYKEEGVVNKVANAFFGKTSRAEVDQKVYSLMNYIYWNTEYTVVLVIDEKNYTKEAQEFLSDFPFNQVAVVLRNISEVTMMLNTGELTYYVDNNPMTRNLVNNKYAVDIDTFNSLLKRKKLHI